MLRSILFYRLCKTELDMMPRISFWISWVTNLPCFFSSHAFNSENSFDFIINNWKNFESSSLPWPRNGWWRRGITSTFIAWFGSWLRDRRRNVEVIFHAYFFFVWHRYLRFENLILSYTSKTLESLRKFKNETTCIPKRYRKLTQS